MSEIRQENLKILSSGFKTQRAFADALDATPGYISQLMIGSCKFGEKAARKIERAIGMPIGWLDVLHGIDSTDYIDSTAVRQEMQPSDDRLSKNQEKTVDDVRQLLAKDIDPMDMVTLQQIINMLTAKYQDKKD